MTREQIIEKLTENKRDDLEDAVEDYEADLDAMTDDQLAVEYEEVFGSEVQIVAHEAGGQ
jgi:hypothetical protein